MPAYYRCAVHELIRADANAIIGSLEQAYAKDGFASQYTRQTKAWGQIVPQLQQTLRALVYERPECQDWTVLIEFPLHRLRRRIDVVILAGPVIIVVECKAHGGLSAADRRQVEEYALDLRDFHAASGGRKILPVLWTASAEMQDSHAKRMSNVPSRGHVGAVTQVGAEGFAHYLRMLLLPEGEPIISADDWDLSAYRPVPTVIDAATSIFAGHGVRSIANADADNLRSASARLIALIQEAREQRKRYLVLLTGVPGSGKTLAGLDVVHNAISKGVEREGDIVYLSGNTPLVIVLREALARDERSRSINAGRRQTMRDIRRDVRTRIQHVNDFLKESLDGSLQNPPHEHVIVFDEAQRAWDAEQGRKFDRHDSEPALLLEIMSRHHDWCACVCLVGSGQEINSGEEGVFGWGQAIREMDEQNRQRWAVFAPTTILDGGGAETAFTLGQMPAGLNVYVEQDLQLTVPQRSYRSPKMSSWVDHVLEGDAVAAHTVAQAMGEYPIVISRSLSQTKLWLRERGRGERRYGLVASSGARRLRAEGLGITLNAKAGDEIAHWYLNEPGDIRASYALEVPANEYTCQGLELDFIAVCWGGDLLWNEALRMWAFFRLSGTKWQRVQEHTAQRFVKNSYRVLLTRAREGLVIWIPLGDEADQTRSAKPLDATADFLLSCGATCLSDVHPNQASA